MKVVLEKHDLISILEKHFGEKFDRSKIVVRADPFEVELSGIPLEAALPDAPSTAATPVPHAVREVEDEVTPTEDLHTQLALADGATLDAPPPGTDYIEVDDTRDASPAALVAKSRALEEELKKSDPPKSRKGGTGTAPSNFKEEI